MNFAPNYAVADDASPFAPLPLLTRCTDCRTPLAPCETWVAVRDGLAIRGLCRDCATGTDR